MGTRGNNGGERPSEGAGRPDEGPLPDVPPEWGTIVIPSDASSLADEGASIRREFRRIARRRRWRRRLHLPLQPHGGDDAPGLAVPLLIMSIAVVATLISLFAVAWPGGERRTARAPGSPVTTVASIRVDDLVFLGTDGAAVRLGDHLPAAVLLVEGCACDKLITETTATAAPSVFVFVAAATAPPLPPGLKDAARVRAVGDPNRSLRAAVPGLNTATHPSVVLVSRTGAVSRTLPKVTSVDEFRADLRTLALQ
jgi:hypothetical protein